MSDSTSESFREVMLSYMPMLKAFALTLAPSRSEADDLVQEALTRAWRYRNTFQEGTSMKSWLCRILQNCFYQDLSRRRYMIEDVEGRCAARQSIGAPQEWAVFYSEILAAIDRMTPDARDALLMVGAGGYSYEEAAEASHCPIGTLKSRVSRARAQLGTLTGEDDSVAAPTLN